MHPYEVFRRSIHNNSKTFCFSTISESSVVKECQSYLTKKVPLIRSCVIRDFREQKGDITEELRKNVRCIIVEKNEEVRKHSPHFDKI